MARRFAVWGAAAGFLGVALGAFGAHALRGRLAPDLFEIFETGVRYHLVHALALFAAAWTWERFPGRAAATAGPAFLAGIVLFSGSLYVLALTGIRVLGAITPLGGVAFLLGWGCLVGAALGGSAQSLPPRG